MATSTNYSITVDANVDLHKIESQLKSAKFSLNLKTSGVKEATDGVKELNNAQKEASQSAEDLELSYTVANQLFHKSIEVISEMVSQVRELDDALTEMNKVTQLSDAQLDTYTEKLGEIGTTVARTTSEMVEAATQWTKSGFDITEAVDMSYYSALLQNISDVSISASSATSTLISQIKAFGLETEDAEHIIDSYNSVAHSFSIGTNDITKAMEVAGAGMATYGNSFEETMGLVVAGTEIMVGRSQQVARGLNTISANIVENKDVLAELGIEVENANGELTSTFDVLTQLKPKWDAMTEAERVSLGATLAGKNQYKVLSSVMSNLSAASEAVTIALDSSGSAMKSNEIYIESLEAEENKLAKAFEDFSNNVISDKMISGIQDLAVAFLNLASTDFGTFITQVTLLTGIGWGTSSLISASKIIPTMITQWQNLFTVFALAKEAGGGFQALGAAIGAAGGAASVALPIATALALAIVAVYTAVKKAKEVYDAANPSLEELTANAQEAADALSKMTEAGGEYDTLKNKVEELTEQEKKRLVVLEGQLENLREQADEAERLKLEKWQEEQTETHGYSGQGYSFVPQETEVWTEASKQYDELSSAVKNLKQQYDAAEISESSYLGAMQTLIDENAEYYETLVAVRAAGMDLTSDQQEFIRLYQVLKSRVNALSSALVEEESTLSSLNDEVEEATDATYAFLQSLFDENGKLTDTAKQLIVTDEAMADLAKTQAHANLQAAQAKYQNLIEEIAKVGSQAVVSAASLQSMFSIAGMTVTASQASVASTNPIVRQALAAQAQARTQQAYQDALDQYNQLTAQLGSSSSTGGGSSSSSSDTRLEALKESVSTAKQLVTLYGHQNKTIEEQADAMRKVQQALHNQAEYLRSIGAAESEILALSNEWWEIEEDIANLPVTAAQEKLDALNEEKEELEDLIESIEEQVEEEYQAQIDVLEERRDLINESYEEWEDGINEIIDALEKEADAIQDEIDALDEQKDALSAASSYAQEYAQEQIDAINEQISALDELTQEINDRYDAEIDGLEAANEEIDERIEREELLKNLEQAKATMKMVYTSGEGFVYTQDIDAIAEAQAELEKYDRQQQLEAEIEALEEKRDAELEAVEAEREALEQSVEQWEEYADSWSDFVDEYTKEQNRLTYIQLYGKSIDKQTWTERAATVKTAASEYSRIMTAYTDKTEELSNKRNEITQYEDEIAAKSAENKKAIAAIEKEISNLEDEMADAAEARTAKYVAQLEELTRAITEAEQAVADAEDEAEETTHRTSYVGTASDGSTYTITSEKGINFIENASAGETMTGGDSSQWTKNADGTTTIVDKYGRTFTVPAYASGTMSAQGGVSLVGEKGAELMVTNKGDGVLPSNVTKTLWDFGAYPEKFLSGLSSNVGSSHIININGNLSLPNVTDAKSFITGIKQLALQYSYNR